MSSPTDKVWSYYLLITGYPSVSSVREGGNEEGEKKKNLTTT